MISVILFINKRPIFQELIFFPEDLNKTFLPNFDLWEKTDSRSK